VSQGIRRFHRWVAVAFTAAVVANVAVLASGAQAEWVGFLALLPLALLQLTGLYLLVQPWAASRRGTGRAQ
jgi:hypothetical protein